MALGPRSLRILRRASEKNPRFLVSLASSVERQAENSTYELEPVFFRVGMVDNALIPPQISSSRSSGTRYVNSGPARVSSSESGS